MKASAKHRVGRHPARARTAIWGALAIFMMCAIARTPWRVEARQDAPPAESVAAKSQTPAAQTPTPVIVELFTSEGCSDCPPADRLLYALEQTQPVAGAEIIPLEQHVDYWNSEGWRDPFSSEQFTSRQKDYVYAFHLPTPYTPEMVVDGGAEFVGSDRDRALAAIAKAAQVRKATLQIEQAPDANAAARNLRLRISLAQLATSNPKHAEVLLAITEDHLASNVTSGENAGAHMNHLAVVRELRSLGRIDSSGSFSAAPDLALGNNWKRENLHAVAFVQDRSTKRILAASTISLAGSNSTNP
jgi:hypothetical protein